MKNIKLNYSGMKFKALLQRNDISYKDAAAALGINKNTVGKAVRGGNLNVDVLLRICNVYGMQMSDFFVSTECSSDYFGGLPEDFVSLADIDRTYKKCKLMEKDFIRIKGMAEQAISLMRDVQDVCAQYEVSDDSESE